MFEYVGMLYTCVYKVDTYSHESASPQYVYYLGYELCYFGLRRSWNYKISIRQCLWKIGSLASKYVQIGISYINKVDILFYSLNEITRR